MDLRTYFDRMADHWDDEVTSIDEARRTIVFLSEIGEQTHILDVACGTGAMFEAYQEKRPKHVTAIDLSEKMAAKAADKVKNNPMFEVRCEDLFQIQDERYDCIVIYNAYPHFTDKKQLVKKVAELLKADGRVTIAHGAGKEVINLHHSNVPEEITSELLSAKDESKIWDEYFDIDTVVDTSGFYLFSGKRYTTKDI